MRTSPPRVLPLFRSERQLRMLARLLLEPDAAATMTDLGRASGMGKASLHRELHRAIEAGLVERDDARRPHVFRPAASSPLREPIAALLRMTVGVEHDLRDVLLATPGVHAAVIHGSWADDAARPKSDVDLLVVGDGVDGRRLRARLRDLSATIGRDIDLTLLSGADFDRLLREGNLFLRVVLERPIVNLVGDLRRLAAE